MRGFMDVCQSIGSIAGYDPGLPRTKLVVDTKDTATVNSAAANKRRYGST